MKIKPNISIPNALIRITCGFTMLSCATAKMVRKPYCPSSLAIATLGAMKVGEGIVRFCPLTYVFQHTCTALKEGHHCGCHSQHQEHHEHCHHPLA